MGYRYQCMAERNGKECGVHQYYGIDELRTMYGHPTEIQESLYCKACKEETRHVNRREGAHEDEESKLTNDVVI
jgi:hypothetical protein